jgi:ribonucleoside-diphosphate reductase alpha chain
MDSRTLTPQQFEDEWNHLANQKSGERGIVFKDRLAEDAVSIGREYREDYRLNPCGEVILRPRQFCNLSEVIVRPYDTKRTLKSKVAFATLLGTLQSTLTDFHFIKDDWKKNSEEERLLGVSLTGLKDHPILQKESSESRRILASLRSTATKWSKVYAHELGINEPASVTSVKPSGTVSQLVNSSSGLHPRWSKYYKRRVENSKDHPLSKWLIDQGVEYEESMYRDSSYVFTFYIEAPDAIFSGDESALEQVKYWKMLKTMYTTHNPSVTILVRPHEWEDLGLWVYNNKPSGMSFLPLDDTVYDQSPFEAISKQEYDLKKSQQPKLDFSIPILEFKDTGKAAGEQGCSGGSCVFGE